LIFVEFVASSLLAERRKSSASLRNQKLLPSIQLLARSRSCALQPAPIISVTPGRPMPRKPSQRPANPNASRPSQTLDTFPNPAKQRDFLIRMQIPEFTCLCPLTGQPDFATLHLDYIADQRCVELKSLKMYVWSFRERGAFHEAVTNEMLDHIVAAIQPRFARLTAKFNVRGGIFTDVVAEHRKRGWKPLPAVILPESGHASAIIP
jgi:7-cyano-7-deazaguanine reductase